MGGNQDKHLSEERDLVTTTRKWMTCSVGRQQHEADKLKLTQIIPSDGQSAVPLTRSFALVALMLTPRFRYSAVRDGRYAARRSRRVAHLLQLPLQAPTAQPAPIKGLAAASSHSQRLRVESRAARE